MLWARCQDRSLGDLLGHVTRHALSACYPVVKERRLLLGLAAGRPAWQASGGQSCWPAHVDVAHLVGPLLVCTSWATSGWQRVVPLRNGCGPGLAASRARSRGAAILPDSSGLSSGLLHFLQGSCILLQEGSGIAPLPCQHSDPARARRPAECCAGRGSRGLGPLRRSSASSGPRSAQRFRRRPTLPDGLPSSTIGAEELNFRVRNEIGWDLLAMVTGN